jgi:hypothetical protein
MALLHARAERPPRGAGRGVFEEIRIDVARGDGHRLGFAIERNRGRAVRA